MHFKLLMLSTKSLHLPGKYSSTPMFSEIESLNVLAVKSVKSLSSAWLKVEDDGDVSWTVWSSKGGWTLDSICRSMSSNVKEVLEVVTSNECATGHKADWMLGCLIKCLFFVLNLFSPFESNLWGGRRIFLN